MATNKCKNVPDNPPGSPRFSFWSLCSGVIFVSLVIANHLRGEEPQPSVSNPSPTAGPALPPTATNENSKPFFTLEDGFNSNSPLLHPGKLDFLFRNRSDVQQYNFLAWTPFFKGGAGFVDPKSGTTSSYGGGYARLLAPWPEYGDLIIGAETIQLGARDDYEFQGEYRLPMGLGFGGGYLEASSKNDIAFGKVDFRQRWKDWNYILEVQGQEVASQASPGGYVAVYNSQLMLVGGTDGEQYRATVGYIAPDMKSIFRPTAEAVYVNNTIGNFSGPRSLFANGTLGYRGGFLSNPSRLGRAMGPQGIEFGNPLGFLSPTWNRRLETWEMGELFDVRAERIWFANNTTQERYDGEIFPFQFFDSPHYLKYFFVGGSYLKTTTQNTPAIIGGLIGKFGFMNVSLGLEYETATGHATVVVGLIDWF